MRMSCSGCGMHLFHAVQRVSGVAPVEPPTEKTMECSLAHARHSQLCHVHEFDEERDCCGVFHRLHSSALHWMEINRESCPPALDFPGGGRCASSTVQSCCCCLRCLLDVSVSFCPVLPCHWCGRTKLVMVARFSGVTCLVRTHESLCFVSFFLPCFSMRESHLF